jgi:predicted RNase H-like HicB family nuclease
MELHAIVHEEDGAYWAEVKELPGCFASGRDLDEVKEALIEAIEMCLPESEREENAVRLDELKLVVAG